MAATRYHVQKAMKRVMVVIHRVRQAMAESQVSSFSGSHPWSTRPSVLRAELMQTSLDRGRMVPVRLAGMIPPVC